MDNYIWKKNQPSASTLSSKLAICHERYKEDRY